MKTPSPESKCERVTYIMYMLASQTLNAISIYRIYRNDEIDGQSKLVMWCLDVTYLLCSIVLSLAMATLQKHRDVATGVEVFAVTVGTLVHLATNHLLDRNRATELASRINGKLNAVFVLAIGRAVFATYVAE